MLTVLAGLLLLAPQEPRDLQALLAATPQQFGKVLAGARACRLQILLGEVVAGPEGRPTLRRSRLGDPRQYFYPASSIKLAGAIAALIELNRLNAERGTAFGLDSEWRIEARFRGDTAIDLDPSNVDGGRLTVRHDLRKLFLVSDNAAYNHCFEFVGRARLDSILRTAGWSSCRLWHRLSEVHPEVEHVQTRGVTLREGDRELAIPPRDLEHELANDWCTELDVGSAWMRDGERVAGPMSFARKNAIELQELQDLLVAVVRPEIGIGRRGFPELTLAQRAFLVQALGELPRESRNPVYPEAAFPDHGCKFVLPGVRRVVPKEHLRVYDKIGRAYGFSIENAYVEDTRTGAGFFLAAVLYTNADGVLNDDEYDYEAVADPFFADLGEVIARAVLGAPAAR
jgi:hypothetical protein